MLIRHLKRFLEVTLDRLGGRAHVRDISEPLNEEAHTHKTLINAFKGDITKYQGDAIVNAANSSLMPGGGVCGAIFAASNFEELEHSCAALGGCPTGFAKVTPSFGMAASHIVHAVGPIYAGGTANEEALLHSAYSESLKQAHLVGARSIAFPAISTGIYGYPLQQATEIAIAAIQEYIKKYPHHFDAIDFVCFDDKTLEVYKDVMNAPNVEQERKYLLSKPLSEVVQNALTLEIQQWYLGPHVFLSMNQGEENLSVHIGEQVAGLQMDEINLATLRALVREGSPTLRVRCSKQGARVTWEFTIKGKTSGDSCLEVNHTIPDSLGKWMSASAESTLFKTRHQVLEDGYLWEIDEYHGVLQGLVVAELENKGYSQYPPYDLPSWILKEVTSDSRFKNAVLAKMETGHARALIGECQTEALQINSDEFKI